MRLEVINKEKLSEYLSNYKEVIDVLDELEEFVESPDTTSIEIRWQLERLYGAISQQAEDVISDSEEEKAKELFKRLLNYVDHEFDNEDYDVFDEILKIIKSRAEIIIKYYDDEYKDFYYFAKIGDLSFCYNYNLDTKHSERFDFILIF